MHHTIIINAQRSTNRMECSTTIPIVVQPKIQQEKECSICLETLEPSETYRTKCNHDYHKECINSWMTSKETNILVCPICRHEEQYDYKWNKRKERFITFILFFHLIQVLTIEFTVFIIMLYQNITYGYYTNGTMNIIYQMTIMSFVIMGTQIILIYKKQQNYKIYVYCCVLNYVLTNIYWLSINILNNNNNYTMITSWIFWSIYQLCWFTPLCFITYKRLTSS